MQRQATEERVQRKDKRCKEGESNTAKKSGEAKRQSQRHLDTLRMKDQRDQKEMTETMRQWATEKSHGRRIQRYPENNRTEKRLQQNEEAL
jgi:hypothetical protein